MAGASSDARAGKAAAAALAVEADNSLPPVRDPFVLVDIRQIYHAVRRRLQ